MANQEERAYKEWDRHYAHSEREKSWAERLISGSSLTTILVALVGQAVFSIVYQIINNEQQAAAIASNMVMVTSLRDDVLNLRTPLGSKVIKMEGQLQSHENETRRIDAQLSAGVATLAARIDGLDSRGSRGLEATTATVQRVATIQERLLARMDTMDKRVGDVENRAVLQLQGQVELLRESIKRTDEQLMRTIQALDALYNSMQDHLRMHGPQTPSPRRGGAMLPPPIMPGGSVETSDVDSVVGSGFLRR